MKLSTSNFAARGSNFTSCLRRASRVFAVAAAMTVTLPTPAAPNVAEAAKMYDKMAGELVKPTKGLRVLQRARALTKHFLAHWKSHNAKDCAHVSKVLGLMMNGQVTNAYKAMFGNSNESFPELSNKINQLGKGTGLGNAKNASEAMEVRKRFLALCGLATQAHYRKTLASSAFVVGDETVNDLAGRGRLSCARSFDGGTQCAVLEDDNSLTAANFAFGEHWVTPLFGSESIQGVKVRDVTGDELLDVVTTGEDGNLYVARGLGGWRLSQLRTAPSPIFRLHRH